MKDIISKFLTGNLILVKPKN